MNGARGDIEDSEFFNSEFEITISARPFSSYN